MKSLKPVPIFTQAQIGVMHSALAVACGRLGLKPGGRAVEDVAVRIVDIAASGAFDVESLTAAVLARREA